MEKRKTPVSGLKSSSITSTERPFSNALTAPSSAVTSMSVSNSTLTKPAPVLTSLASAGIVTATAGVRVWKDHLKSP